MPVVRVTPNVLDLLRRRAVFLDMHRADRWQVGDPIGFDADCAVEPYAQVWAGHVLPKTFGAFSYARSDMARHVRVGRYCSIARAVAWMGQDHPIDWAATSPVFYNMGSAALQAFLATRPEPYPVASHPAGLAPVEIGSDVWIGEQAMIAPGVRIGHGAVVGARALVLHDVAPYAVVVGALARLLRYRLPEALIPRFLELAWWRFPPDVVARAPVADPRRFLDALAEILAREGPTPMAPVLLTGHELMAAALGAEA